MSKNEKPLKLTAIQRRKLMGATVQVFKVLEKDRDFDGHPSWTIEAPGAPGRAGWCVGFGVVRSGKIETYNEGFYDDYGAGSYAEVSYLVPSKSHPCMLVRYRPNAKPVRVPLVEGAWTEGGTPDNRESEWPQDAKEYFKRVPRDARGRFR